MITTRLLPAVILSGGAAALFWLAVYRIGSGSLRAGFEEGRLFWVLLSVCGLCALLGLFGLVMFIIGLIGRGRRKGGGTAARAKFLSYRRKRNRCSVRFTFEGADGVLHTVKTGYKYTPDESEYLGELKEFDVQAYGRKAEITEELKDLDGWAEKRFGSASRAYDEDSGRGVEWEMADTPAKPYVKRWPLAGEFGEEELEREEEIPDEDYGGGYYEGEEYEGEEYGEEYDEAFYDELKEIMREMMLDMMADMLQNEGEKMMKSMMKDLQKDMNKALKKSLTASMNKMLGESKKEKGKEKDEGKQ